MFARLQRSLLLELLLTAVVGCSLQVAAVPVHVSLEWPGDAPASARASAHLDAVRTAGSSGDSTPARVQTEAATDGTVLDLSEGVWQVQAFASGYWSQQTEVVVARQAAVNVRFALWPAASLYGEIVIAEGEPLPGEIEVQLNVAAPMANANSTPTNEQKLGPSHAELHCRTNQETWNCLGPAGIFDVRLEAAGYTPRYLWATTLSATGATDLGKTELRRGTSVFGRAIRKDGASPGPCRATLQPDPERNGPADPDAEGDPASAPEANKSYSARLTEQGYFQMVGMIPGRYRLLVECQAASGINSFRVLPDSETRLDAPLLLQELTLALAITPKVDPQGRPWQLALEETAPHSRRVVAGATTSADGTWIRRGLMAGNYRLVVNGSDGSTWLQRYFNLDRATGPLLLSLESVNVSGRVLMNSQPVRARLLFSNNEGGQSAILKSDDQGRFEGLLPVAPHVLETTWTVQAHVAQLPILQSLLGVTVQQVNGRARLDLQLPTVAVRGSVLSKDGQPQPSTEVTFEGPTGERTTTSTDDAGRFEMPELPPGKYTAVADSPEGASDRTSFDVTDGRTVELRLVLNAYKSIAFQVVSAQGPVVHAAVQAWVAPGVPLAFMRSGQDGRFTVKLPPGITEVGMTIGAPGYALKMVRRPVPSENDESPDAHTITLDASGVTLVLNPQPSGGPLDSSDTLYLVHNATIQEALTIPGWGTDQAGAPADGPAVVDAMEPGEYALCVVSDPAQLAALWKGSPPSDRCSKGSADPGGTLTLSAP